MSGCDGVTVTGTLHASHAPVSIPVQCVSSVGVARTSSQHSSLQAAFGGSL